jgi:hypothetical protein
MFTVGQIVYLKKEVLIEAEINEDCLGFEVLAIEEDDDGTIPVKRIVDGQYACLPTWSLTTEPTMVTGSFFINAQGKLRFVNVHLLNN